MSKITCYVPGCKNSVRNCITDSYNPFVWGNASNTPEFAGSGGINMIVKSRFRYSCERHAMIDRCEMVNRLERETLSRLAEALVNE